MPNFISYHPALDKERLNELISFPYIHKYNVFDIFKTALNCISLSLKSSAFSQCKYRFMSLLWNFGISHKFYPQDSTCQSVLYLHACIRVGGMCHTFRVVDGYASVTWFTQFFGVFVWLCLASLLLWPGKSRASRCEVSRVPIFSDLVCWSISQSCPYHWLASNTWSHVFLFETLPFGNMVWLVGASVSDLVCW